MIAEPKFTIGIEEEYYLVDRETRDLVKSRPEEMMAALESRFKGQVVPEFISSQIEVGTKVCKTIAAAGRDLRRLRKALAAAAKKDENLMPLVLDAVEAQATEGEVMDVFREVYGEYVDPGIF